MSRTLGYSFVVEGEGQFPTDMLRYDHCWPRTTEDAIALPLSVYDFARDREQHRKVALFTPTHPPTVDRWVSFGWKVSDIKAVR